MFRESFNDLRAWHVLQGSGKSDRDLLSLVRGELGHDWLPAPLNTYGSLQMRERDGKSYGTGR